MKMSKVFKVSALVGIGLAAIISFFNSSAGSEMAIMGLLMLVLGNQYASEERWAEVVNILDKQFGKKP